MLRLSTELASLHFSTAVRVRHLLAQARQLLGGRCSALLAVRNGDGCAVAIDGCCGFGLDDEQCQILKDHYASATPDAPDLRHLRSLLAAHPDGEPLPFNYRMWDDLETLYRKPRVGRLMTSLALSDALKVVLPWGSGRQWVLLMIGRGLGAAPFDEHDRMVGSVLMESLDWVRQIDAAAFAPPPRLPRRLRETLDLVLRGFSEKDIATQMRVMPSTVHTQVRKLYALFDVASRAELMSRFVARPNGSIWIDDDLSDA